MAHKRRRKKKNGFIGWFKNLSTKKKAAFITVVIVLLLFFLLVLFVAWKFSKINIEEIDEEEIIINEFEDDEVGVGYTNFVLFGGDSRTGDVERNLNTDAIIVVSLNNETKEVKMVSVYRDTLLDLSNGVIKKCNAAYSRGGAKQAINMLNMNLDLNIQKYVTVSFEAVIDVIDMLGGIEVDVSEAEMAETNRHMNDTAKATGRKPNYITYAGVQTLDGIQATTYARIRKGVGDDFARTERQRLVIQLAAEKAMKSDLSTLNKIIDAVFPQVSTNLTMSEILRYAKDVTKYQIGESTGFPFDRGTGTIPGKGSCVYPITLFSNVQQLHEFLYGAVDYQPSSKVQSISSEIQSVVGYRPTDKIETSSPTTEPEDTTETPITVPTNPSVPEEGSGEGSGETPETGEGSGEIPGTGEGSGEIPGSGETPGAGEGSGETSGEGDGSETTEPPATEPPITDNPIKEDISGNSRTTE